MALFGRDYDNDYGRDFNRGGMFGNRPRGGRNEVYGNRGDTYGNRGGMYGGGWDQDRNRGSGRGRSDSWTGAGPGAPGYDRYDRSYRSSGYGGDYDRNYKSQWQTDHGDPFGDRSSHTPMRVIRGEYQARGDRDRNDRGWFGSDRDRYEADYSSNPMGYDPYRSRESSMERGWGMRGGYEGGSRYGRDYRGDRY